MEKIMKNYRFYGYSAALILALIGCGQIYLKTQTALVGYDLGRLKAKEAKLLDRKSVLQMELAKITDKTALLMNYKNRRLDIDSEPIVSRSSL